MEVIDEAAWDFGSISWYEKLLMFATEYPIEQVELASGDTVCALSEKQAGLSVLTVYSLPPKLRKLTSQEEGLVRDYDLKIQAGTFTSHFTTQIACVYDQDYLYASQSGLKGVVLYKLNTKESDKIIMTGVIDCGGIMNPNFDVKKDVIVAACDTSQDIIFQSFGEGEAVTRRKFPEGTKSSLFPAFLTADLVVVSSSLLRRTCIYDMRQERPAHTLPGEAGEGWRVATNFSDGGSQSTVCFGFVSGAGELRCFDLRWPTDGWVDGHLGAGPGATRPSLRFDPSDSSRLSVCGLDSRVYVVDTKPTFSVTFTHSGHEHTESCAPETLASSHFWYTLGGPRCIVSSALNSSLNCWTYNPQ